MIEFIFDLQRFALEGSNGDDVLRVTNSYSKVYGYGGNDSIYNYLNDGVSIDGGSGNDTIINNWGWYLSINGGADNDKISLASSQTGVTVKGGTGDDTIYGTTTEYSSGVVYQLNSGDGNDLLYNYRSKDTISIGGGAYYTRSTVGSNVVVSLVSGGSMVLSGASDKTINITGGSPTIITPYINNYTKNTVVSGTSNKDTIRNYAGGVIIQAGAENDSIYNSTSASYTINNSYGYVTIDGGAGNDTIYSNDPYVSINAGAGNDSIYSSYWSNVTVRGGEGNDTINVSYATVNGGTGNDSILSMGNNVIQFSAGDGTDTIQNYNSNDKISLQSGAYYTRSTVGSNVVISLVSGGSIVLSGASDKTINITGGIPTIITPYINNYTKNTVVSGTSNKDTIRNYAGGVIIQAGAENDSIYNSTSASYTINNSYGYVTINGGEGNDTIYSNDPYVSINAGAGNDSVYSSYWSNVTVDGGAGNDTINVSYATVRGGTGNDSILSMGNNVIQFVGGDGADTVYNYDSNDRISLQSGAYYTRSTVGSNVVVSLVSGGSIVLSGASDKTINITGGIPTINPFINSAINNYTKNTVVSGTSNKDTIRNYAGGVIIQAGAENDSIYNSTSASYTINNSYGYVTINGGEGNDTIYSNDPYVSINAGAGNDSVYSSYWSNVTVDGGAGNDTINVSYATVRGGTGNDSILSMGNNVIQFVGGDGADTVYNYNSNDRISLQSGAYYTRSTVDSNVVVSLVSGGSMTLSGASDKPINITGGISTINPFTNSAINNYTKNTVVSGTSNKDTIRNYAGGVIIQASSGDDSIYNSTSSSYTINNSYGYVTIDGGAGNDTIYSNDPYVSINAGTGNDSIYSSWESKVTINGGDGADTIHSNGGTINGGAGNDIISLMSSSNNNVIQFVGGDGADTIYNYNSNSQISLQSNAHYTRSTVDSNVVISLVSGSMTLNNAKGKQINITGGILDGSGGGGNTDTGKNISNSNSNTLITGTNYDDTIKNYGDTVTINASAGNDTIYNYLGDDTSINAGNGKDSIYGHNNRVTVSAGAGQDTISGNHYKSKLFGDGDNDLISISSYYYNTIDGGSGNDTIIAGGGEHSVNGGAGADLIRLSGDKLTVKGGTGNDTIYGDTATSHLYQYASGDGNDIIYNWSSSDSLTITGGNSWSSVLSGNNVLINVANSGTISLYGAKGKTIKVYPGITPTPTPTPSSNVSQQDVIKKFMRSLDTTSYSGVSALNQAVKAASGGYFNNVQAAINQMIEDCRAAGNANNFLLNYCGINLNNDDTGAITGYDAGGSTYQKTAKSIVPESGSVNSFTSTSFKTNGLTVKLGTIPYDNRYVYYPHDLSYSSLNSRQKYIWQAFQTWWASGALDLIAASYGSNYGFSSSSSATAKTMYFGFFNQAPQNGGVILAWTANFGDTLAMAVNFNSNVYGNLASGGNPDGQVSDRGSHYLDRTLAHEMTHAVMSANISSFNDLPQFIKEGMAELTIGADDDRYSSIVHLANASYINDLRASLSLTDLGTGTVGNVDAYAGGYMFLRYLAKQGSEHYPSANSSGQMSSNMAISNNSAGNSDNATINGSLLTLGKSFNDEILDLTEYPSTVKNLDATALANGIMIFGNEKNNSIAAGIGNDSINGNTGDDTLLGGAGNDVIYGDAGKDLIEGGTGNDTMSGGSDDDTLRGGDGKDIFVFGSSSGNDLILDYTPGDDKIKFTEENASVVSASVSGNDVLLNLGLENIITIKDGNGQRITIIDSAGKETTSTYSDDKNSTSTPTPTPNPVTLTVKDTDKSPLTLGSTINIADASKRKKAIKITGNDLDNTISGGSKNDSLYGGNGNDSLVGNAGNDKIFGDVGNDSLWGNAGNDTLTGGAGSDLFIYTAGKDIIADYAEGDKISVGAAITNESIKSADVIFTLGKGTLTVKNAKGKTLNMIDQTGNSYSKVINGPTNLTLSNSDKSPLTLDSTIKQANASKRKKAIKITGNDLDNTISGGSKNDSLYGGNGNDSLVGNAGNDKIFGDAGNDSLWGNAGNDTLTGGAGSDLFIYTAGKDIIADYAEGDKISVGAAITNESTQGADVIFTLGKGTLTVKNAKGKTLNMIDQTGNSYSKVINGPTNLTLSNSDKSPLTLDSTIKQANASKRKKAIKITGNDLDNTISGGSKNDSLYGGNGNDSLVGNAGNDKIFGGKGNDSLWGGKGNDSLWGDAGADIFIYKNGDGKDVIFGFDDDDTLTFDRLDFKSSYNAKNGTVTFDIGSTKSAITLRTFTATTFNINNDTYQISNNKFVKKE